MPADHNRELLELAMRAGSVTRYHTIPNAGAAQDVGNHTYGVMAVLDALYSGNPPAHMLRAALYHDAAEAEVGDMPYTTKVKHPKLRSIMHHAEKGVFESVNLVSVITEPEKFVLKIADLLEMSLHAKVMLTTGNVNYYPVLENAIRAAIEYSERLVEINDPNYTQVEENAVNMCSDLTDFIVDYSRR